MNAIIAKVIFFKKKQIINEEVSLKRVYHANNKLLI